MNHPAPSPHLLDLWRREFSDAARRRGASGRQIGDAWATVESHCADAHCLPLEAFGPPEAYARELFGTRIDGRRAIWAPAASTWAGTSALVMVLQIPWVHPGREVAVSAYSVAEFVGFLVVGLTITAIIALVRSPVWRGAGTLGCLVLCDLAARPVHTWQQTLWRQPAWSLWLLAGSLLAVSTIGNRRVQQDRTTDPRLTRQPSPGLWTRILPWVIPLIALALLAMRCR